MLDPRPGLPEFWATGVAKALVGDQPCLLPVWLGGHYKLPKRSGDEARFAQWKAEHTAQLEAREALHREAGWKIDKERFWRVKGQAAVLVGKSDLILQKTDCRPVIEDVKSGRPEDHHTAQVLIYMVMLPLAWNAPRMQFAGRVVYPTHTVELHPHEAEAFRPKLMALMRRLGTAERPVPNPGRDACRFCEVPDEACGVRYVHEIDAETEEF